MASHYQRQQRKKKTRIETCDWLGCRGDGVDINNIHIYIYIYEYVVIQNMYIYISLSFFVLKSQYCTFKCISKYSQALLWVEMDVYVYT